MTRIHARPIGLTGLSLFFLAGACISGVTALALLTPGGPLEWIWRLKPSAHTDFLSIGAAGIPLMLLVSAACAFAARGLWTFKRRGLRLALGILGVNLLGDLFNALIRHDLRALIGLPIGGLFIWYLLRPRIRGLFAG